MKRVLASLALVVACLIFNTPRAEGQIIVMKPVSWQSPDECMKADNSPYYIPSPNKTVQTKLSFVEVIVGHPTGGCFKLRGIGWVRIEAGRRFVQNGETGIMLRFADSDVEILETVPFPAIQVVEGRLGETGAKAPVVEPGLVRPPGLPAQESRRPSPTSQNGSHFFQKLGTLGITASGMFGFNSNPIAGMAAGMAGLDALCLQGKLFDIGGAMGGQQSSIWRLTFAVRSFDEGAWTLYSCAECPQEVKVTAGKEVRNWGVQLERIQRIEMLKNRWSIQPMLELHAGVGRMTGEGKDLFWSDWLLSGGAGVGVMGDVGENLTVAVTAIGVESLGIYYGRLQVTWWP